MRRHHATSPGFSGHYQDLGISSEREAIFCCGSGSSGGGVSTMDAVIMQARPTQAFKRQCDPGFRESQGHSAYKALNNMDTSRVTPPPPPYRDYA